MTKQTEFFVILDHFLPFYPPNNPKNQNFGKSKKAPGDIINFTHAYHKWQSYDVWFLRYEALWTGSSVILDRFLPFYAPPLLTTQKIKILKNWKKRLEILSFYTFVPYMTTIWCMVPEISSTTDRFFSFWTIFCPFTPLTTRKNENFIKMKETPGDIITLHKCTKNYDRMVYRSWDGAWRM